MAHVVHHIDCPRKALEDICNCVDCIYAIIKEDESWILDIYARPHNMIFIERAIAAYM